ncbi:MAG: glycosyltransferase [Eubacterium sp.]|nr:glycosyltransferase [Eubacterium sp.]
MNSPHITVMIPVYNMKGVIGRAIESVLSQDYSALELMVLDGGSTDGTLEVIKKYEDRIGYFVSEKDEGPSAAMAAHIASATGDYVTMLGADDYYEDGAVAAAAAVLSAEEPDVAYGDCNYFYPDGRKLRKNANSRGLDNLYYYNSLFSNAVFVRKQLLEDYYKNEWMQVRDNVDISTDHLLWLLLYNRGRKFSYIESERALTNYAVSGRSSVNEFIGCMDDEYIINMVLKDDPKAREKYMPVFNRYLAARSVLYYRDVVGKERFHEEIAKGVNPEGRYVIFGIGDMSRKVLELLEICGIKPEYFVDNNAGKNDRSYFGYDVYTPARLVDEKDVTVIISALGNEEVIRQQMAGLELSPTVEFMDYSDWALDVQNVFGTKTLREAWKAGAVR